MNNVETIMASLDLDTPQHDYIIDCLKSAVSYCKSQYIEGSVDWLPTVNFIGLQDEADKFKLLEAYLSKL